ncbi:MAG: hypothetical protein JXC32_00625 [Anaerolineae bacterium]|nr:hypothetical protein [Anaerolineae bacterium]
MKKTTGKLVASLGLALIIALSACARATPTPEPAPTATPTSAPEPEPEAPTEEVAALTETSTASPVPTPIPEMTSPVETPEAPSEEETEEPEEMPDDTIVWMADGLITEGEYTDQADFGDIRIWWQHDGEFLYLAMEGDTTGWVAVGINPQNRMQGANYMFGYVADGIARLWDAYGTAPTGANHPPDAELGGTDDVVTFTGEEQNGVTRFEIQIPLDSGDQYDQPLAAGNSYPIIVAIGGEDAFNAYHTRYDRGELILAP